MPVSVADFDYGPERMVVRFEADGPIDLEHLAKSLGSLERLYERQQREHGDLSPAVPSRLFVSRVETGSILVEIAPLLILMNEPLQFMAATNTIKTFSQNMIGLLRQFAGDESGERVPADTDTVKELQQFIKPLTGRKAAELDIVHARYGAAETSSLCDVCGMALLSHFPASGAKRCGEIFDERQNQPGEEARHFLRLLVTAHDRTI